MALNINGVEPTEIKYVDSSGQTHTPNIYTYATTGDDLKEATRAAVSSYTSTQLNGWVGKENDTWSGITNVSQLEANKYYYIRVYVTDTQKYGKFCVMFKSASGTTITVDNKGWGYDGEVIYSTPVWGKPFTLTVSQGTGVASVTVNRTSSPNQHASTGTLSSGATIYYGDVLSVSATASTNYTIDPYTSSYTVTGNVAVNISATQQASYEFAYAPVISGDYSYDGQSGSYFLEYTITNRNAGTVDVTTTQQYDSFTGVIETYRDTLSAYKRVTHTIYDLEENQGIQIVSTFSATGFKDSTTTKTFGSFEGEDTSTTTTTTTE